MGAASERKERERAERERAHQSKSKDQIKMDLDQGPIQLPQPYPESSDYGARVECRVCGQKMSKGGYGPHARSHRVAIGEANPRVKRKKKSTLGGQNRRPPKTLSVEDACIGLIMGVTGRDSIPLAHLGDVSKWINETEKLVEAIK